MTVQEVHTSRSSPTNEFSEHNFFVRWRHLWEAGSYFRVQGKKGFFLVLVLVLVFQQIYQFPTAAVTKYHKWGCLEQQKLIVSLFWRPEVPDQFVGRAMLPLEVLEKSLFQACLLASVVSWLGTTQLQSSHGIFPLCMSVRVSKFPLFIRTPVILPTLKDFILIVSPL